MAGPIMTLFQEGGGPGVVFSLFLLLLLVPFVLVGLTVAIVGLLVLIGHSEIELSGGKLRAIERAGPLHWTRSRPADAIRRLEFSSAPVLGVSGQPITSGPLANLDRIRAVFDQAKPLILADAYPVEWLRPLADDLARRCPLLTGKSLLPAKLPVIDVFEVPAALAEFVDVFEIPAALTEFRERDNQPADSTAFLDETLHGLTITLPPTGLLGSTSSRVLFIFGLSWCGLALFISLFVSGVIPAALPAVANGQGTFWPIAVGILSLFGAIGIGLLLTAYDLGRREVFLDVVGDTLMISQTGLFGGKKREWPREQIVDIRTGPGGWSTDSEGNSWPIIELQIHVKEGKKVGLLMGRDEAELSWIATVLRRALQVPSDQGS
jgi:hypothetical protein